ncbi:MAG: hypothetical protein II938_02235 [Alphaproteobacteria bacterium]|nr:hypothetical protein [Alphaproteobacteria bacterium]
MKKLFVVIFAILLVGCATQNIPGIDSYEEITMPISKKEGNIIVKRDKGLMGIALGADLYIDNNFIASLGSGNFVRFKLDKGSHFVSISSGKGTNLGTAFERTFRLDITDDTVRTLRIFPMPGQGMIIEETMN